MPGMLSLDMAKFPNSSKVLKEIGYKTKLGILQAGLRIQKRKSCFIWGSLDEKLVPDFLSQPIYLSNDCVWVRLHFVTISSNLWRRQKSTGPRRTTTVGDAI